MRTFVQIRHLGLVALIGLGVGLAGCQSSPDRTTGMKISDTQVERSVKKALGRDVTFKYTNVRPNVYSGTIQLTGFVETPEQRLRAAEIAAQVKGAKQVINHVMIKPGASGAVAIRDPLGKEAELLLVDTNAPVPELRNLSETKSGQTQTHQGAANETGEQEKQQSTPK